MIHTTLITKLKTNTAFVLIAASIIAAPISAIAKQSSVEAKATKNTEASSAGTVIQYAQSSAAKNPNSSSNGNGNGANNARQNNPNANANASPIISGVNATSVMQKSAHIIWTTDQNANSFIWYDTKSPVPSTSAVPARVSLTMEQSHDIMLDELQPGTTYYFLVGSMDSSMNTTFSSEGSFTIHMLHTRNTIIKLED